jgi:hypothetical protein
MSSSPHIPCTTYNIPRSKKLSVLFTNTTPPSSIQVSLLPFAGHFKMFMSAVRITEREWCPNHLKSSAYAYDAFPSAGG